MQSYEESNRFQAAGGGGGFNPVKEPDIASSMERELRAGERRDQPYYDSLAANDKTTIKNAQIAADSLNKNIETNLKALGQFSQLVSNVADDITRTRIREKQGEETFSFLDRGAQYLDGNQTALTAPESQELAEGQQLYEENDEIGNFVSQTANSTDDPIAARAVRQTIPSPQIVGSERIRLLNAQSNFSPSWLSTLLVMQVLLSMVEG